MRLPPNKRSGAFTLIEIMVAMAIFSMVVAAIYSTWTMIIRASRAVQQSAERVQRERITRQTLIQAVTCAHSFLSDGQYYSFDMDSKNGSTLSFVARLPESFPRSGRFGAFNTRRVTFSVEGGLLVMRQNPILMQMDEDEQNHPMVLATDVKTFKVEAFDPQKGEWTDEWLQTNEIPDQLRISMEFVPPGQDSYAAAVDGFVLSVGPFSKAVDAIWQSPYSGGGGPAPGLQGGGTAPGSTGPPTTTQPQNGQGGFPQNGGMNPQ